MWRDVSQAESHRPPERDIAITAIDTMELRGNPHPEGGYYSWGIVKVETDAGYAGIGETFRGSEPVPLVDQLAPLYVGQNPLDPRRLTENANRHHAAAGGFGQAAITAIETACWDIKGKVLDTPVYELLGGKFRDEVVVYSDTMDAAGEGEETGTATDDQEFAVESFVRAARDVVDQGFEVLKFDLDYPSPGEPPNDTAARRLSNAEIREKAAMVEAVRDEVGPDIDLGMDVHWLLSVESAIRLGQALEPYDLAFYEDPVHPRKIDAQVRVRDKVDIPILTGENIVTPASFTTLLQESVMDIAAPDVAMAGGLGELVTIASFCDAYGVPLAPHNLGSPVSTVAGAHVGAAIPNFLSLEFRGGDTPWWNDLLVRTGGSGPVLADGRIDLPEGPGLGVAFDHDVAPEYLKEGEEYLF
ncbi:MAG: mandelate racemase/muconate lactonizing enzyme family protein [Halobacteriales archaeon]|nr:mandelate racemase/muconate lactonizing enzyme family protein [Halobacteriales archaeon]